VTFALVEDDDQIVGEYEKSWWDGSNNLQKFCCFDDTYPEAGDDLNVERECEKEWLASSSSKLRYLQEDEFEYDEYGNWLRADMYEDDGELLESDSKS
jgi:hypothetical protein